MEKKLSTVVVPAATLGRHAAADLVDLQQLPMARGWVLAALIGVDQELIGFDWAVAQGPADHPVAVQTDPDRQVPRAVAGADVGMSPAQERFGSGGVNSCCSRFSATPATCLPLPRRGLKPCLVLDLRAARRMGRVMRCRPTKRPVVLSSRWIRGAP